MIDIIGPGNGESMCSHFFLSTTEKREMQFKSVKKMYNVEVEFQSGLSKNVKVKATSLSKAEEKALKFNPSAVRVKRA